MIEDNVFDREVAIRALQRLPAPPGPAEVLCAGDWAAAVPHIETGEVDLVLLDFYLPGRDGPDILGELMQRPHPPPVVMMTGQDDVAKAVQTLRAGARDYVPKGIDWETALGLAIERVLERLRLERELADFQARLSVYALELEQKVAARTAMVYAQAKAIERLYLRTEETSRIKEEILANVSHEFRTPLSAVLGLTQLLADELPPNASPTVLAMLSKVRAHGERLLQLVESLLTLRRLKSSHEGVIRSRFTLASLIEELRADAMVLLGDKGLTLDWRAPAGPCEVEHDREKIRLIAYHLLSNAIKFTPAGRVEVSLANSTDGGLVLTVTDTGIGIPLEARAAIFDDFRQLDGSSTRCHEGLGLGLGIVKRYTALLRGTVRVESVPGRGTTITVELPGGSPPPRYPGLESRPNPNRL